MVNQSHLGVHSILDIARWFPTALLCLVPIQRLLVKGLCAGCY
jgi:hypothetical protein